MATLTIIDRGLADYETLLSGLPTESEVLLLDTNRSGLEQIAGYLDGKTGYDSLHILSHGSSGTIYLGNSVVNTESLNAESGLWQTIGNSLTETGDILLYGSNVAEDEYGQSFVRQLAQISGADVAASTDITGATSMGGDWELEVATGPIETQVTGNVAMDYLTLLNAAFASYANTVYQDLESEGYRWLLGVNYTIDNALSGLYLTTYQKDNEYIVTFRGTEFSHFNDVTTDVKMGWPQYGADRDKIQALLLSLAEKPSAIVHITGHSLGGALAQFATYDFINGHSGYKDKITLTTWNSLGGVWALRDHYREGYNADLLSGVSVKHYYRYDDFVSRLGDGCVGGEMVRMWDPNREQYDFLVAAHRYEELKESLLGNNYSSNSPREDNTFISASNLIHITSSTLSDFGGLFGRILNLSQGQFVAFLAEETVSYLQNLAEEKLKIPSFVFLDLYKLSVSLTVQETMAYASSNYTLDYLAQLAQKAADASPESLHTARLIGTMLGMLDSSVVAFTAKYEQIVDPVVDALTQFVHDAIVTGLDVANITNNIIAAIAKGAFDVASGSAEVSLRMGVFATELSKTIGDTAVDVGAAIAEGTWQFVQDYQVLNEDVASTVLNIVSAMVRGVAQVAQDAANSSKAENWLGVFAT